MKNAQEFFPSNKIATKIYIITRDMRAAPLEQSEGPYVNIKNS